MKNEPNVIGPEMTATEVLSRIKVKEEQWAERQRKPDKKLDISASKIIAILKKNNLYSGTEVR